MLSNPIPIPGGRPAADNKALHEGHEDALSARGFCLRGPLSQFLVSFVELLASPKGWTKPGKQIPYWLPVGAALALAMLGCGGGSKATGDQVNTANQVMTVSPATATLAPGQTAQFTATIPWGGSATWAVLPAAGGTFSGNGLFTASSAQGQYRIVAMWNNDVRYTATATATILPPAPPADSTPDIVSASGAQQTGSTGQSKNSVVVGEAVPAKTATDASGTLVLRHGFRPAGH